MLFLLILRVTRRLQLETEVTCITGEFSSCAGDNVWLDSPGSLAFIILLTGPPEFWDEMCVTVPNHSRLVFTDLPFLSVLCVLHVEKRTVHAVRSPGLAWVNNGPLHRWSVKWPQQVPGSCFSSVHFVLYYLIFYVLVGFSCLCETGLT